MNDILFEVLKLIVMLAIAVLTRYFVPWVKTKIEADKLEIIKTWVKQGVLWVQQVYWAKTGTDRKAIVTEFLKQLLLNKNISLSDEQLDTLIEAAVKQMKIEENATQPKIENNSSK